LVKQAGQIDEPSDLLGGKLDGPPQMRFGPENLLALFGQLGLSQVPLGGIESRDLRSRGGSLVETATQEAGRLQVILEEIALASRLFGFSCAALSKNWRAFVANPGAVQHAGEVFGAPTVCPAQPEVRLPNSPVLGLLPFPTPRLPS
jgi:hypothetical protein